MSGSRPLVRHGAFKHEKSEKDFKQDAPQVDQKLLDLVNNQDHSPARLDSALLRAAPPVEAKKIAFSRRHPSVPIELAYDGKFFKTNDGEYKDAIAELKRKRKIAGDPEYKAAKASKKKKRKITEDDKKKRNNFTISQVVGTIEKQRTQGPAKSAPQVDEFAATPPLVEPPTP
jgi:hypothetical protein